ncbi:MAG: class I SAM-dependent methyltransferase [Blastocatellia bacterium]|nr:class I SAM-dependent methyltransferase [Blastocatellia bacterium]
MNSNKQKWEYFGEQDPYFGVSTFDKFKSANIDDASKAEFFETGEEHIGKVIAEIRRVFDTDFSPSKSLDYGCGVGRLVFPLAKVSQDVTGVDISAPMLAEAVVNAERMGVSNVKFQSVDEFLANKEAKFDLVHSLIVFQHIEPKFGLELLREVILRMKVGGYGALQFTYEHVGTTAEKLRFRAYRDLPFVYKLRNIALRKKDEPLMSIYSYDLHKLLAVFREYAGDRIMMHFTDHGFLGVTIYFQRVK